MSTHSGRGSPDRAQANGLDTDVLVLGGGMAGLCAAVTLAQEGLEVLLAEKGPLLGGSARISGGLLWTEPDEAALRRKVPRGDPALGRLVVEGLGQHIEWLASQGVRLSRPLRDVSPTVRIGYRIEPIDDDTPNMPRFVARMTERLRAHGGQVACGAAGCELLRRDGTVTGALLRTDRGTEAVRAGAVLLCTGGFQGEPALVRRYITQEAARLQLRANPHSTGDGLRAATAVGAATSGAMHAFYGHLLPAPPALVAPEDYIRLAQFQSTHGLLVDITGRRFVDESESNDVSTQALARRPRALGFLLMDAALTDPGAPLARETGTSERLALVAARGGAVLRANDLEGLAAAIGRAGANAEEIVAEVRAYQHALRTDADPAVPRRRHRHPFGQPPLTAVPVVPGITSTHGGLRIDGQARVLDLRGQPIPGLCAAGNDVGGVSHERYVGGLAPALVLGRTAALHVAGSTSGAARPPSGPGADGYPSGKESR